MRMELYYFVHEGTFICAVDVCEIGKQQRQVLMGRVYELTHT